MSQKILVCSINPEIRATLACAFAAYVKDADATIQHRATIAMLNRTLRNITVQRRDYIAACTDEDATAVMDRAVAKFPSVQTENAIRAENARYKNQRALYAAHEERARRLIPKGTYEAYKRYMVSGNAAAFTDKCAEFAAAIGCGHTDSPAACRKFAETMLRFIGAKKSSAARVSATGHLTDVLSELQFNEMFIRAFCDAYAITARKLISGDEVAADNVYA